MPKSPSFKHWPDFKMPGVNIRGIGVNELMMPTFVDRPRGMGDFLLMLFHDAVDLGVDGAIRLFAAGTLMLWRPGAGHQYGSRAGRWSHSWIHCAGPGVVRMISGAKLVAGRPQPLENPTRVLAGLLDLHEELVAVSRPDPVIVRNTLENVFREAARGQQRQGPPPVPAALARAKLRIDTEYFRPLSLNELADTAAMSSRHFCTQFGRCFGVPPMAYLAQRRLNSAATLLRGGAVTVAEVARQVGFGDVFHFSKQFKKQFGAPPSRFSGHPLSGGD